ncbi:MAG: hypothetical protein IKF39_01785 [Oscillospiraceae bacterium]|nr:hypothetical protein [Oscillospiraceae bacterium]
MDAVQFAREQYRMCELYASAEDCGECPIDEVNKYGFMGCAAFIGEHPEVAVRLVEEWSKAHPVQTNAQKFEEVFGEYLLQTRFDTVNRVMVTTAPIGEWWNEPYKEPERSEK